MGEKKKYRVEDWKEYNKGLCGRYDIDLWLSEKTIKGWYHRGKKRKAGAQKTYSKGAILACHQIRSLLGLTLRGTQGFLDSLFQRFGLKIRCPHYSQMCRRAKDLRGIDLKGGSEGERILFALVDSTGLKVYGEGEWHVKMHKASRRRTWRKLSVVVDPVTHKILENKLTISRRHDANVLLEMLPRLPTGIEALWGDGAYDMTPVYEALHKKRITPIIPAHRHRRLSGENERKKRYLGHRRLVKGNLALLPRDAQVDYIHMFSNDNEGRKEWKKKSSYHLRSLVETTMMRFKQIFSDKLRSRTFKNQEAEVRVKCSILNTMMEMAWANSYAIETVS